MKHRKASRGHPIITEEKLRAFLLEHDPPLVGTRQVAEHFDVSRQGALKRLDTMEDRGVIRRVDVGQNYGWWLEDGHPTEPQEADVEVATLEELTERVAAIEEQLDKPGWRRLL